jgi:hypothetical protein
VLNAETQQKRRKKKKRRKEKVLIDIERDTHNSAEDSSESEN